MNVKRLNDSFIKKYPLPIVIKFHPCTVHSMVVVVVVVEVVVEQQQEDNVFFPF
jgi:hypothetical protein